MSTQINETPDSTIYWFSTIINSSICSIVCIVLLSTHVYKFCKHEILSSTSKFKEFPLHKLTSIISFITIILFTSATISAALLVSIDAIFSTHLFCNPIILKLGTALYQMGKTFMYLVFVLRLHSIYNNTAYAFNKYVLCIGGGMVIIISLTISISAIYVATPMVYKYELFNTVRYQCTGTYPNYQLMAFAINEIIVTIVILYAFIYPLRKMLQASKLSEHNCARKRIANSFKFVAIKISCLTLFAMCSSFVSMIVIGATKSTTIAGEDMIINSVCIMLMYGYYSKWYYKCCYICIKCCNYYYSTNKIEMVKNGQIIQEVEIDATMTNKSDEREGTQETQESNQFNQTIPNLI